MESFYVDLSDISSKKPRVKRQLLFGAIIILVLIISSLAVFLTRQSSLEWYFIIVSIYLALYTYYAWLTYKAILFVKGDDTGFHYNFGLLKRSKNIILWDVVTKVKLGPAYIRFFKKSGRRKLIQLNWLPYSQVIEIKDSLIKMCKSKNIPYEKAEIIDYSKKKDIKK